MECTNNTTVSRTSAWAEARNPEQSNGDFWVAMSRQIGRPRQQATPVTLREATKFIDIHPKKYLCATQLK